MIAHWDEVETYRREQGPLGATWTDLGGAAGSIAVGLHRIQLAPGEIPTPVHVHGDEEEIFYVLGGSGLSWQDGFSYELRAHDCTVHRVGEAAHTLRGGPDGLDVLAFGMRARSPGGHLPRAGVTWMHPGWVDVPTGAHPWEREEAAGELVFPEPSPERPETLVNLDDPRVPASTRDGTTVARTRRALSRAAGAELTGLQHVVVPPGRLNAAPHCHSAEEELFVVLAGAGALELSPALLDGEGAEPESYPVRTGHVVARPAGSGRAHVFRAGDDGLTLLAYGTKEPNDICYYPRSRKVYLRGVGLIARLEHLDYWDGED